MKKSILITLIVALVVSAGFFSMRTMAYADSDKNDLTVSKLVELLIQLGIIPSDKIDQARNIVNGNDSVKKCQTFDKNLSVGSKGDDVVALHDILTKEGFGTTDDSKTFGESTASAVVGFQEKYASEVLTPNGLARGTGYVGNATRAKLNALRGCTVISKTYKMTPSALSKMEVGTFFSETLEIHETKDKSIASWSVTAGSLPPGITLADGGKCVDFIKPNKGKCLEKDQGLLAGTPTAAGTYSFTIQAKLPSGENSSKSYTVTVKTSAVSDSPIVITSPNGGETWQLGETRQISWYQQYPTFAAIGPLNVILSPYVECAQGMVCTMFVPAPHFIVKNYDGGSPLSWTVGSTTDASYPVTPGKYTLSICNVNGNACDSIDKPFTIASGLALDLTTDKSAYVSGQNIVMTLKATNNTSQTKTLQFTNGCLTSYKIDQGFDSSAAQSCILALTSVSIGPNSSKTWTMTHEASDYQVPAGTHTITATLTGYGSASATITVSALPIHIDALVPTSGPVGTVVTISGAGFTANSNTIHFGYGVIPNATSTNPGQATSTIAFTVPPYLNPACYYATPRCLVALPATQIAPGIYSVYVSNENGTSNAINFQVTN